LDPASLGLFCSFFFQAEDGIRAFHVTGVQTCALPICALFGTGAVANLSVGTAAIFAAGNGTAGSSMTVNGSLAFSSGAFYQVARSEERRVGKEVRCGWTPDREWNTSVCMCDTRGNK